MLSVVILTKNEEKQIATCLKSVLWADEIVIIDSGSADNTLEIAKQYTKKIINKTFTNFSDLRNEGLKQAKHDWILYVDADEEITKDLADEIRSVILGSEATPGSKKDRFWTSQNDENGIGAYFVTRRNFYLGQEWPVKDKVERLFKKDKLTGWQGQVHESPQIKGEKGELKNELTHRTHNSLEEMLNNTIVWSDFEAEARFKANHPSVTWWRIFRMMLTSFWEYYVKQRGWSVGTVGLMESIYQSFSIFITYAKLWELQNHPFLSSSGLTRGSIK